MLYRTEMLRITRLYQFAISQRAISSQDSVCIYKSSVHLNIPRFDED